MRDGMLCPRSTRKNNNLTRCEKFLAGRRGGRRVDAAQHRLCLRAPQVN
jgi:hypothetical protein